MPNLRSSGFEDRQRAWLTTNFYLFVRYAFGEARQEETSESPYLEALCFLLQEAAEGRHKRLLANLPPRMLKSFCLVSLAAWLLGRNPRSQVMIVVYGEELARELSDKLRSIVRSAWYRQLFPATRLARGGDRIDVIRTTGGGHCRWATIGGAATGLGADFIFADDLMKAQDVNWPSAREELRQFLDNTLFSRFNHPAEGVFVSLQQRLHADDVIARLSQLEGFRHVSFPAIAVLPEAYALYYGRTWSRRAGELLDRVRLPQETLNEIRQRSPDVYAAQYQQAPEVGAGAAIDTNRICFMPRSDLPPLDDVGYVVQAWDTGITVSEHSSYSVGVTLGWIGDRWILLDLERHRLLFPDLIQLVVSQADMWEADEIVFENGGSGLQLSAMLRRLGRDNVYLSTPAASKEVRFAPTAGFLMSDEFAAIEGADYAEIFRRELTAFPNGDNDDIPDALSVFQAWTTWGAAKTRMMSKLNGGSRPRPTEEGIDMQALYRRWLREEHQRRAWMGESDLLPRQAAGD